VKLAHSLYVEAFLYPSEERKRVEKAVSLLVPGVEAREEAVESYYGPPIIRLVYETKRDSEIKKILKQIVEGMSPSDREDMMKTLRHHLDEHGCFYLRFDKQSAYGEKLVLAYKGDVIKMKLKMASYPFSVETVREKLEEILHET
jgi:RNA binding exosome subunit